MTKWEETTMNEYQLTKWVIEISNQEYPKISEKRQFYAELRRLGVNMTYEEVCDTCEEKEDGEEVTQ